MKEKHGKQKMLYKVTIISHWGVTEKYGKILNLQIWLQ